VGCAGCGGSGSGNMALRNIENGLRLLTKIDKWKPAAWRPVLHEFQKNLLFSLLLVVEH
jgi:hypothetical protein